ncbi:MAG: hypothetical protein WC509_03295 [Candidatus Izemoplasmatales bacterium]
MKTILRPILSLIVLASLGVALVGCSADGLSQFLLTASRGVETAASLDDVDEADLTDAALDELSVEVDAELETLALELALTPAEKVAEIRRLRAEIRLAHASIVTIRATVRAAFQTLRDDVAAFRASDGSLSEEERAIVAARTEELKTITAALRDSIGSCYERMHALRGRYDRTHLDEILAAHQDVLEILDGRLAGLTRVQEIFAELTAMVALPEE